MYWKIVQFFLVLAVLPVPMCHADDDVAESSSQDVFKLKKYNKIWERALGKTMSNQKLVQLKKLLHKFDRMELDEKHGEAEERNDGSSIVDDYVNQVLKEYDLLDDNSSEFEDVRLNELWRHAMKRGDYTDQELQSLHNEMKHMEKKLSDVHGDAEGGGLESNMVDSGAGLKNDLKTAKEEKIQKEFKVMKNSILKKKKKKPELKDERVQRLWDSARSATFSEDELDTVKEELLHFQRAIDKLAHWEEVHVTLKDKGAVDERSHAESKLGEYKRKVKKYHKTMVKKIEEKTEL